MKQRSLQLLKSKEYWKWEDLVGVIVREARGVAEEEEEGDDDDEGQGVEEKGIKKGGGGGGHDGEDGGKVDIRIPEKAITEASKVVTGVLEKKVELEPEGKGYWD